MTDRLKRARICTSIAARILRERSVSEVEFDDLTYSKAPPLEMPEICACQVYLGYWIILRHIPATPPSHVARSKRLTVIWPLPFR
jgi:hypothetical protein